jgi:hypothetical protein
MTYDLQEAAGAPPVGSVSGWHACATTAAFRGRQQRHDLVGQRLHPCGEIPVATTGLEQFIVIASAARIAALWGGIVDSDSLTRASAAST